jgi:endonuclease YncB( thermonuclease family)
VALAWAIVEQLQLLRLIMGFLKYAVAPLMLLTAGQALAGPISGIARGKDGDSLMVGETEVRLFGIDAPEFDQSCNRSGQAWACGAEAANRLSQLVTGKDVRCIAVSTDQYGRTLGRCTVGTTDINRTVVSTGYAVAYRRYSSDYVSAEETAKVNRRGIWAGSFEMPSAYRHDTPPSPVVVREVRVPKRLATIVRSAPLAPSGGGCLIKGNQGTNGWIYHVPGMPYYTRTRAEQMFCSEAEARAAGYRRAKAR